MEVVVDVFSVDCLVVAVVEVIVDVFLVDC